MTAQLVDHEVGTPDSDPVLLTRVRSGDAEAYAVLFTRHRAAATAFAGGLAGHGRADDLVAEAFTKVLDALQRDLGPTVSFRSYLLTAIRSVWLNTVRRENRYDLVDDYDLVPASDELVLPDDPERRFDNQAVSDAFRSLPERWQAVLWLTAVESLPHDEVAVHLGIKPNAVAALAFRAREGLRRAYLSQHLTNAGEGACREWLPLLPAYARGSLDRRKEPGMKAHLDSCVPCVMALADLDEVNNRLGALLLPIVLGPSVLGLEGLWPAREGAATSPGSGAGVAPSDGPGKLVGGSNAVLPGLVAAVVGGLLGMAAAPDLLAPPDRPPASEVRLDASQGEGLAGRVGAAPFRAVPVRHVVPAPTTRAIPAAVEPPVTASGRAVARPEPARTRPAGETAVASPVDARPQVQPPPADPPIDTAPPGPEASSDAGIGEPTLGQLSLFDQALTTVAFPLSNVRTGSTLTVVVTNLVGFPLALGNEGWQCPGAVGGLPGDVVRTETTITCTRTGPDLDSGAVTLALLSSGASDATATLIQGGGLADPFADNNTASIVITG